MKNIKVELDSVDVTSFLLKATKSTTYGDAIALYELTFTANVNSLIALSTALNVDIYSDSSSPPTTKIFEGFVDNFKPEAGRVTITCKDQLAQLINRKVTHNYDSLVLGDAAYPDGKISDIFRDLVETYGGLSTNSGATVQDSGTDLVIDKFVCNGADVFERCRKLADALNWVFYYRADTGYVYFEPKNFTTNATAAEVGTNVVQVPTWEYDRAEMINDLTIKGVQQLIQTEQYFSGDAAATEFTLTNTPIDVAVYYSAAKNYATTASLPGEIKIGNITNSITTHDYEVDVKNKTVTATSFVPANSANNLLVKYSYYEPISIHMEDAASKTTYGIYAKEIIFTDCYSFQDGWKRGENYLAKYSQPFKSSKLKILWNGTNTLRVGQQIPVKDSINVPNIDENMTIYRHFDMWPEQYDEIEVGDKQYTIEEYQSNIVERVKRLEEDSLNEGGNSTEVVQDIMSSDLVTYSTVIEAELINDSFVLDHSINGVLYTTSEVTTLDDFESAASWVGTTCTLADDSTAGHYWIGTQGVKATWTGAVTATLTKAITSADISLSTGQNTGTPTQGTVGLWVYASSAASIGSIKLKLGSSATDYCLYTGSTYAKRNSVTTATTLQDGLNYIMFNLDSPDEVATGTPVWTACDYALISITTLADGYITFDYLTSSKSNDLGKNGIGDRAVNWSTETNVW